MKKLISCSLPLAAALLLIPLVAVPDSLPLASTVQAATLQDTLKESTRPALDAYDIEEMHSLKAPVPWLLVEDHRTDAYDADGKLVAYSSYPTLRVKGAGRTALTPGLAAWNKKQAPKDVSPAYRHSKEDRETRGRQFSTYYDYSLITTWGRADEHLISFCLYSTAYLGGAHPAYGRSGVTLDAKTGREVRLAQVVTGREALFQALAAAFRAQYPAKREGELFEKDIKKQLEKRHPAKDGLDNFSWYMGNRGELIFLYSPYALAPYASGEFQLTIERKDAPGLFTKAYPMK